MMGERVIPAPDQVLGIVDAPGAPSRTEADRKAILVVATGPIFVLNAAAGMP